MDNNHRTTVPPLGVHLVDRGATVAVFSAHAEAIELCVFDGQDRVLASRKLSCYQDQVFFDHVEELKPGTRYGLRAHGPWDPGQGHRFNPQKLLIDPYARCLDRTPVFHPSQLDISDQPDGHDSAAFMPKAIIRAAEPPLDPGPSVPWQDTIIYEAHVKGLTHDHPAVPETARGRFAGLGHPAMIDHLVRLGVTTVELLPVQTFMSEARLNALGLVNYWGYNTIGFLAPHPAYGDADPLDEFRSMVQNLHRAGLEVILDVVYNHTGEGDHLGPTLSFRGLDNASYYRLNPGGRRYANPTGCGNALDASHPRVIQLIMDSLRYWACDMGVDGFRFDLATTLARGSGCPHRPEGGLEDGSALLACLMQDPVLSRKKLIMEPWDVGPNGYRLGCFPPGVAEWNDRFRDSVRAFWRGDEAILPEFAARLAGSADLFDHQGRTPRASINFVTSHDGFTLRDLVTYNHKHNDANGEQGRDGHDHNHSANYGIEGETGDPVIRDIRYRQCCNIAATMMLAQGVPMWLGGDEILRTQKGNNNAYCQDNPISWVNWSLDADQERFLTFIRTVIALRMDEPLLRQGHFLHQDDEICWWHSEGRLMNDADWHNPHERCLGLMLMNKTQRLLLLLNAADQQVRFQLPRHTWLVRLSTMQQPASVTRTGVVMGPLSLLVLSCRLENER